MHPWDVAQDGFSNRAPAILLGDGDGVLGCWLWPGLAPAAVDDWGSKVVDGRFLSV